jgi:hypothetical protein
MAGDWIKMRAGLETTPEFVSLRRRLHLDGCRVFVGLYRVAAWFQEHGHYGKLQHPAALIDQHVGINGFADALDAVGWLRQHGEAVTLHHFTDVSAGRKSLGRKVRAAVLSAGKCAACGSAEDLVVDHKTPIVRGGSCELENLQALCAPCNRSKGRKTMNEWEGR